MANFGALGTLRHAYRTLNKPSTSALVRSVSVNRNFGNSRNQTQDTVTSVLLQTLEPIHFDEHGITDRRI